MTKQTTESMVNDSTCESRKNSTACRRNMLINTLRRPMASESQAHRNRPEPLAMEMRLTKPAAVATLTCDISWAIGEAWEIIAMPAFTFKNSVSQRAYHCQVRSACERVKFEPDDDLLAAGGWNPAG